MYAVAGNGGAANTSGNNRVPAMGVPPTTRNNHGSGTSITPATTPTKSTGVSIGVTGPNPAKFSVWFGVAAVAAIFALILLWPTKYRSVGILIVIAIMIGWALRYTPEVEQQIGSSLALFKGKGG